jgi:tRNA (adenine-N(1)-)-methyltransferase non-catalytic subunit
MGRLAFDMETAIGLPYGVTLEVVGGKLARAEAAASIEDEVMAASASDAGEAAEHNRHLPMHTGNASHQLLKQEDIEALKQQGSRGVDIVGRVVENSATFKAKTVFAQEK